MANVQPLEAGTLLGARYEIASVLGRGGFSIAYSATDLQRKDACVVKELAPSGSSRGDGGLLDLSTLQNIQPATLKDRFLEEARLIERLSVPGVPRVRDEFEDLGTAYFVTDFVPGATTLQKLLGQEGRMDSDAAFDILLQLLDTLEAVHAKGVLHRDIKPSNVLLDPSGVAYLIDFGAAREWHADQAIAHTVMYTPGYAPIEQLSERARRGPGTDLYGLSATAYHMLAGFAPRSATERAAGTDMVDLGAIRTDLDKPVLNAIRAGLQMQLSARPQSVADFRKLLSYESVDPVDELDSVEAYDRVAVRLREFSFKKRECPACGDLLESPKPLKRGLCPVCREATIERRSLSERLCPVCRTGVLQQVKNSGPLLACPVCRTGKLSRQKHGLLGGTKSRCDTCHSVLAHEKDGAMLESSGRDHLKPGLRCTWDEWRKLSGRSAELTYCDTCDAQFDTLHNGKRLQVVPSAREYEELYPDEWARVASGLPPDSGNASCPRCSADFQVDADYITLLTYRADPFKFGKHHANENIAASELSWLAVGKASPHAGLLCHKCGTEFDDEPSGLRFVRSGSRRLQAREEDVLTLEDWHRVAHALPLRDEEDEFQHAFTAELERAFTRGDLPFESRSDVLWRSSGSLVEGEDRIQGSIALDEDDLRFEKLLRKRRWAVESITHYRVREHLLELETEEGPVVLVVEPVEMEVELESGRRRFHLGAAHLGKRIGRLLSGHKSAPLRL